MEPVAAAWLVLLIVPHGVASTPTPVVHAKALRKKIFETDKYDAKIRPAEDQNLPTGYVILDLQSTKRNN